MLFTWVVFWVILIWGLYDGDIYPQEAAWFAGIWFVLLIVFVAFNIQPILFIVPTVLLDIVLILKVFGGDLKIR